MAKMGLVIFVLFVGILLGGILQEHVCHINGSEDLGTGKSMIDLTCKVLLIPLEIILLVIAIAGAVVYYIKTKE